MDIDLTFWKTIAAHWIIRYNETERANTHNTVDILTDKIAGTGNVILNTGDTLKKMLEEDYADIL